MKKIILLVFIMTIVNTNLGAQNNAVYSRSSVRCLGIELDGSQTLRVLGYGRNRSDAKEQAMKNAVSAVIFDGIHDGVAGCNTKPLVTEVNARERHEDYFNLFFSDGGAYKEFVSLADTKTGSGKKLKDKLGYSYDLTIRVLRPQLKKHLQKDKIIK